MIRFLAWIDQTRTAFPKARTSADSDLYLLDTRAAGAKPQLITPHPGNISHGVYGFTRDGKQLVYSTDEHGEFTQAWTYDVADGRKVAAEVRPQERHVRGHRNQ